MLVRKELSATGCSWPNAAVLFAKSTDRNRRKAALSSNLRQVYRLLKYYLEILGNTRNSLVNGHQFPAWVINSTDARIVHTP